MTLYLLLATAALGEFLAKAVAVSVPALFLVLVVYLGLYGLMGRPR